MVYAMHWKVLRKLALREGVDWDRVAGQGDGWMKGRTVVAYAQWLDEQAGHASYAHAHEGETRQRFFIF
jgi:hypothetical protein